MSVGKEIFRDESLSVRPELVEGSVRWFDKLTTNGLPTLVIYIPQEEKEF